MIRALNDALRRVPVPLIWALGAIPFALLVFDTVTNNLGVDPVQRIEHRLGRTALYLLVAGLAVTPLLRLTGISLMRFRRAIGVLCFGYALAHVLAWMVMDMGLLWGQMGRDIVKRPYLLFGMLSFVAIFALGITSNNLSIRRVGAGAWRRLHRLVYPAALLAGMHWLWAVKVNEIAPLVWASVIVVLLVLRIAIPRPLGRAAGRVA
ncbi:sulfite oxidase heme-binding subunit YedZ [Paracoccus sp. (in: a-proteobacteria)]|uniref:sulfite oxidase heme-binding subunit YedZ n=1 Tax=Paracoccus sp. TaxID=267 RepID=UPI00272AE366|nr:protein-methionine-sulfoxide reductase heme-binding subunit MsrQ [Paracoccus sp. (in: a-proteobacteria)]